MSLLSIDWQPNEVVVACRTGPEQPPAVILPRENDRITGAIVFDAQGEPHLCREQSGHVESGSFSTPDCVARIDAVCELAHSGLRPERVWLRPGGPAQLIRADDKRGELVLTVGSRSWSTQEVLWAYAVMLHEGIESIMRETPSLLAVMGGSLDTAVCTVDALVPARGVDMLRTVLHEAGFSIITFVRRWAAAAAWRLGAEHLSERCLVLDWQRNGLQVVVCSPSRAELSTPIPKPCCSLRSACEKVIHQRLTECLPRLNSLHIHSDGLDDDGEAVGPRMTSEEMEQAAAALTDQLFRGIDEPQTVASCLDDRPFEERYAASNHAAPSPTVQLALPSEHVASLLREPLLRIHNGLAAVRQQAGSGFPNVVCGIGPGFRLPGAGEVVGQAFALAPDAFDGSEAPFAAAKGALLLPGTPRQNHMPYDCGILLQVDRNRHPTGALVLHRGQPLPCEADSKTFDFAWQATAPLTVSIYLRKVDFIRGIISYTRHGWYPFLPAADETGHVRLRAQISVNAEGQIDVTVIDLVGNQQWALVQMGILGGQPLAMPPARTVDELNGGLFRRLLEQYRVGQNQPDLSRTTRTQFRAYLDASVGAAAGPQQEAPRAVASSALQLDLREIFGPGMIAASRDELEQLLRTGNATDDSIRQACRKFLSEMLILLARGLADFTDHDGHDPQSVNMLRSTATAAEASGLPLSPQHFAHMANKLAVIFNRLESTPGYAGRREMIERLKQLHQGLLEHHARICAA